MAVHSPALADKARPAAGVPSRPGNLDLLFYGCGQESDQQDVRELKEELLALLSAVYERIQSLEAVQEQQDAAIQVHGIVRRSCCFAGIK
jgi:hypothetical protein